MAKRPCICNGSRGTDCDYCGGSGWITAKRKIPTTPPKNPPTTKSLKYKPEATNNQKIKVKPRSKKTFDQRLNELTNDLRTTPSNSQAEVIVYLGKQIKKLYVDIIKLEPKVKKKQRSHFNKISKRSLNLIYLFDEKFEAYGLLENKKPRK